MELFITYNNDTKKIRVSEQWFCKPLSSFIMELLPMWNLDKYWTTEDMVKLNEWYLCHVNKNGEPMILLNQMDGKELYLRDYDINPGDHLMLVRHSGRRFYRDKLFWIIVEYQGQEAIIELMGEEELTSFDLIRIIKNQNIFQLPDRDESGQIYYKLGRRKHGEYHFLDEHTSLISNKVKQGDSIVLISTHVVIPDSVVSEYIKNLQLAPNGEGYYLKSGDDVIGPYSATEIMNLNLPYDALISTAPQYDDWFPRYLYDIESESFLEQSNKQPQDDESNAAE